MKKSKSTSSGIKLVFGKKKKGKLKKSYGPKTQKPKPYKGQGR